MLAVTNTLGGHIIVLMIRGPSFPPFYFKMMRACTFSPAPLAQRTMVKPFLVALIETIRIDFLPMESFVRLGKTAHGLTHDRIHGQLRYVVLAAYLLGNHSAHPKNRLVAFANQWCTASSLCYLVSNHWMKQCIYTIWKCYGNVMYI